MRLAGQTQSDLIVSIHLRVLLKVPDCVLQPLTHAGYEKVQKPLSRQSALVYRMELLIAFVLL